MALSDVIFEDENDLLTSFISILIIIIPEEFEGVFE
jgi:hypothetical protein